jgi:hypothetical protein
MSMIAKITVWSLLAVGTENFALLAQAPPPAPPPGATAAPTPAPPAAKGQIQFATPVYDFGKVKSGDPVKYTYIFTNVGSGTLEVTHVQPQCGCTTAGEFTKKVEPGQTGLIPIQFNSGNYPAGPVTKMITVTSSDPDHPQTMLQLKGAIWKPIDIQPTMAVLNIPPDGPGAPTVVKIINNTEEPLVLTDPQSNNRMATAALTTNQPGKEFQLAISAVPPIKSPFNAAITIKTSATNMPVLTVPFWVNVQPAVTIVPSQVMLPAGPLADKAVPSIRIESKSAKPMKLTEPAINAEGVEVQVKEIQPDRIFEVQLTFPAGFQLPQGRPVTFKAKSSLTQYPEIEVPVTQPPRPMNVPKPQAFNAPGGPAGPTVPPRVPPAFPPRVQPALPTAGTPPPHPPQPASQ